MPVLRIYTRRGCHLCEELIDELLPLVRDRCPVEIIDVDSGDEWRRDYGERVPLVSFDGRVVCEYRLDRAALLATINAESGPIDAS